MLRTVSVLRATNPSALKFPHGSSSTLPTVPFSLDRRFGQFSGEWPNGFLRPSECEGWSTSPGIRGRRSLKPTGTYVATDLGRFLLETPAAYFATKILGRRRVKLSAARRRQADIELLKELIDRGEFRAVVDRRYPLERVADAHRYAESWQKVGNVVLTIDG